MLESEVRSDLRALPLRLGDAVSPMELSNFLRSGCGSGPGSVPRSGTHVRISVVLARESFAALVARERLFLRVNGPVPLRVFEPREPSLAASDPTAVSSCRIFEGA